MYFIPADFRGWVTNMALLLPLDTLPMLVSLRGR
jgi:hypothetical protein